MILQIRHYFQTFITVTLNFRQLFPVRCEIIIFFFFVKEKIINNKLNY